MKKNHEYFMKKALQQAQKAEQIDEVPIGAIVVNEEGKIIGRGYNQVQKKKCQTAHAEVFAIQKACRFINDWRLDDCWIYVTLQPCIMCMGLIQLSRCKGLVYGASSPLFGYQLDKHQEIPLYRKDAPEIVSGINSEDAADLLRSFFKRKRSQKNE